jgi:hypothetical protein
VNHWLLRLGLILAAALLAVGAFAACDDDEDDDGDGQPTAAATVDGDDDGDDAEAEEVEAAVQRAFDAWNGRDVDGLIAAFTEQGLVSSFGDGELSVEDIRNGLPEFIGTEPISNPEFSNTSVDGDSASTDAQFEFGPVLDASRFLLVREAGEWKINGEEEISVEVPDGYEEVRIDALEFAFDGDLDAAAAAEGPLALAVDNIGQQDHELVLASIPADADLDELLRSEEEDPEGVEFIGGVGPIEPGDTQSLVLLEPLEPGRYVMVCFLPDTSEGSEGEPHAFLGMVREFTVEGAAE